MLLFECMSLFWFEVCHNLLQTDKAIQYHSKVLDQNCKFACPGLVFAATLKQHDIHCIFLLWFSFVELGIYNTTSEQWKRLQEDVSGVRYDAFKEHSEEDHDAPCRVQLYHGTGEECSSSKVLYLGRFYV